MDLPCRDNGYVTAVTGAGEKAAISSLVITIGIPFSALFQAHNQGCQNVFHICQHARTALADDVKLVDKIEYTFPAHIADKQIDCLLDCQFPVPVFACLHFN